MEHNEAWKRQLHNMSTSDLAMYYQWLFTIVDGLLAENRILELGGSVAKNNTEVNFFVDDYATNKAKINHYHVFLDYIAKIFDQRITPYIDDPIPGFKISDEEREFYAESSLTSLMCNFQIFSVAVTELQKTEELLTRLSKKNTTPENKTHLQQVTQFHTFFVTRLKCIIKTIVHKMAK